MNKYAFLENVPGLSVDNYVGVFNDGEWENIIAGCDGVDAVMDYAKKLISEGAELINLCGDFTEENVKELEAFAPGKVTAHYAAYTPKEMAKLEALSQYAEYVMIIFGNVEEPHLVELNSPEMHTCAVFVKDVDMAVSVAQEYAKKGIDGIELCSGFHEEETNKVITAVEEIDPKVPVGSNGL